MLDSYHSIGYLTKGPARIKTIDMVGLTALTIFNNEETIIGIHGHYGNDSAIVTYENLDTRQRHCMYMEVFSFTARRKNRVSMDSSWYKHIQLPSSCGTALRENF
jgi:hypothetical protein